MYVFIVNTYPKIKPINGDKKKVQIQSRFLQNYPCLIYKNLMCTIFLSPIEKFKIIPITALNLLEATHFISFLNFFSIIIKKRIFVNEKSNSHRCKQWYR
ncbi:hypothetical protein MNB_SM-6-887 [hydrothermal vent metagenome]|uniref:Uncharacterized protein n=1 Tax=hydrothermal vent metagenome TaxID=652676 RepID=A0A1W1BMJ2_9ZZZZ